MERGYSLFEIKSLNDEERVIEGWATSIETDRQFDIVVPRGGKFVLPLPLLFSHDATRPIGQVLSATVTDEGISIRAQISRGVAFIEDAWRLIKSGLVRGLSIGFRPLSNPEPIEGTGGFRWASWELLEVSCVTIPANASCNLTSIKSFDKQFLLAAPAARFHLQSLEELDQEFCNSETMTAEDFGRKHAAILKLNARRAASVASNVKRVGVPETAPVTREQLRGVVTNVLKNSLTGDKALSARLAALEAKKNQSGDSNYFGASVERLEAIMSATVRPLYDDRGKLIGAAREMPKTKGEIFEALEARIKALEARPNLKYVGTYREGTDYDPGSVVTLNGSMFHCEKTTTARPGVSSDWLLCVKHGRDLR